jgi:hypothetical protein
MEGENAFVFYFTVVQCFWNSIGCACLPISSWLNWDKSSRLTLYFNNVFIVIWREKL